MTTIPIATLIAGGLLFFALGLCVGGILALAIAMRAVRHAERLR